LVPEHIVLRPDRDGAKLLSKQWKVKANQAAIDTFELMKSAEIELFGKSPTGGIGSGLIGLGRQTVPLLKAALLWNHKE
jgi:hypothetical protein